MKKKVGFEAPRKAYLKSERVQDELSRLPGWTLAAEGKALLQSREFGDVKAALAFIWLACRLAATQGQPVEIRLAGEKVMVKLQGHPVRGCTGGLGKPVFNLAEMIG
ncbi:MAG: 4a-hydroxytetrahydrobiopterin dehydratase [Acidobacteriota bacterium]